MRKTIKAKAPTIGARADRLSMQAGRDEGTTPDERISHYQQALKDLDKTAQTAERLVSVINDASRKLKDWRNVGVSDAKTHHIPPEFQLGSNVVSGRDWPTTQQLGDVLSAWHEAYARVRDMYMAIRDKSGLKPPPQY